MNIWITVRDRSGVTCNMDGLPYQGRYDNITKDSFQKPKTPQQATVSLTLVAVAKYPCKHGYLARCFAGTKKFPAVRLEKFKEGLVLELVISSITTMFVNLILFSSVPAAWWFFRHRKEEGFFQWVGLYKPQLKTKWYVLLAFAVLYYFFYNFDFTQFIDPKTLEYIEDSSSISGNVFAGIGAAAILPAFIQNFIANGVAEEILYRGFLCKRFCSKAGIVKGVLLQAVLFGLMHNILYVIAGLDVGLWYHTLVFIFTGMGALLLGCLNEKLFNGSILPSILLHGTGNFIVSMLVAFS